MDSSTRLLVVGAIFLAMLWLPGEAGASLLDWDADETGRLPVLSTEYLVGDLLDRVLGPFDPFCWSDLLSQRSTKTNGKKHLEQWKPVRLVTCQGTAVHEDDYAAEPPSGADSGSSGGGGGGGGPRSRHRDQLLSSPTPTVSQALSYDPPPNLPDWSNSHSYSVETAGFATPLPPSVLLFGSGLAGLIALGRKRPFRLHFGGSGFPAARTLASRLESRPHIGLIRQGGIFRNASIQPSHV